MILGARRTNKCFIILSKQFTSALVKADPSLSTINWFEREGLVSIKRTLMTSLVTLLSIMKVSFTYFLDGVFNYESEKYRTCEVGLNQSQFTISFQSKKSHLW